MKKFLAVLLSVVLCATVVYSVCAEEILSEEEVVVVPDADVKNTVEDLEDQLANDAIAQEKAEEIVDKFVEDFSDEMAAEAETETKEETQATETVEE